jgi:ATP-dependent Lon protease
MVTALVSALTKTPIKARLAMTGEVTLSGHVLPVGGIKEKVLAARRAGIREIVMPVQNEKNVREDIQPELLENMTIHYARTIDEVLALAFPGLPAVLSLTRQPVENPA